MYKKYIFIKIYYKTEIFIKLSKGLYKILFIYMAFPSLEINLIKEISYLI